MRLTDPAAFIRANTRLQAPPHVPEIQLHLADEALELWRATEAELEAIGLPPPYWAFAWAGGQALARYVLDHPDTVRGRRVLSIAAGSGVEAIAALKAGAAATRATDIDAFALTAMALNAATNGVQFETSTEDVLDGPVPDEDVILMGDVFYERPLADRAFAYGQRATRAGRLVLTGDPRRSYFPGHGLTLLAQYRVSTTRALEDAEVKHTSVWRFE